MNFSEAANRFLLEMVENHRILLRIKKDIAPDKKEVMHEDYNH